MASNLELSSAMPIEAHLDDLHIVFRRSALGICIACIFWSYSSSSLIMEWLEILPIQTSTTNGNLSVYGPFDWVETRWALILTLSVISILPFSAILIYSFSRGGLFPNERTWLSAILVFATAIIPLAILGVWTIGIPIIFGIADSSGNIEGIGVRYDAPSIISLAMGLSWIIIVWSLTLVTLSLARIFGLVEMGEARLRMRILAISCGMLILTLPYEFDGMRILPALIVVISADRISSTAPAR